MNKKTHNNLEKSYGNLYQPVGLILVKFLMFNSHNNYKFSYHKQYIGWPLLGYGILNLF